MQEEIYKNLSPEDLPGEVWKDVVGYEGVYKISNKGRLSSFKSGSWKILSEINKKGGYLSVVLKHGNKIKSARIHRLVYTAFVGEIPNLPISYIHHKDGNKQNNCVCNLELLTPCEHSKIHRLKNPNIVLGMNKYNKFIRPKKVIQKDIDGNLITIFNNCQEASDCTGVCARNIHQVASKTPFNDKGSIRKQAGGFIWEFLE